MSFAPSFPLMIPYVSYLGCYVVSDNHLQHSTYPCNPHCHKTNTMLFLFCLFVGNSRCWVERTFWPLLLYFLNQSFIMTITEVIVATFMIKSIIWCQCLDVAAPSPILDKSKTEGLSWINFFTRPIKLSKDALSINLFALFFDRENRVPNLPD